MSDLTAAVLAAIAARRKVAEAATPGPWRWSNNGPNLVQASDNWRVCKYACTWHEPSDQDRGEQGKPGHEHRQEDNVLSDEWGISVEPADAAHIAANDPTFARANHDAWEAVVQVAADITARMYGRPLNGTDPLILIPARLFLTAEQLAEHGIEPVPS